MEHLCEAYKTKPPQSEIAAASSMIFKEYSSIAATATLNPGTAASTGHAKNLAPGSAVTATSIQLAGLMAAVVALVLS
jgi:hypothetical protein